LLLFDPHSIDKQSLSSKWHKALDKAGASIQVWPIKATELPRWITQRITAAGMTIDNEALQLLSDRVEGNLLAAVQEIEKLKLLADNTQITADTVAMAVADNARYSVFGMGDATLEGKTRESLHMLHGLRSEGAEPAVVLWTLTRDIRTLYDAQLECEQGQSPRQALSARRVWASRLPLMQTALSRHDSNSLAQLLEQAALTDGSIKGFAAGSPWDRLEKLVVSLSTSERLIA